MGNGFCTSKGDNDSIIKSRGKKISTEERSSLKVRTETIVQSVSDTSILVRGSGSGSGSNGNIGGLASKAAAGVDSLRNSTTPTTADANVGTNLAAPADEDYLTRSSQHSQSVTVLQAMDPEKAALQAVRFPVHARNRGYAGLSFETEGNWNGPYCFVQAADTQFGMMDSFRKNDNQSVTWEEEVKLTKSAVSAVNAISPTPRFFVVCGDLVDAMPGVAYKADQIRDLKACLSELRPEILPVCVCGNHDIGDVPTPEAVAEYCADFGDDYFSFWMGGVKFVVINSQFYHDSSLTQKLKAAQDSWIDSELAPDPHQPRQHLVGFQHIPPFVSEPEEDEVDVPGNSALKFNFQDRSQRRAYLAKLKAAGMKKLFCGHYHRNAGGWDQDLEVIVTSAIGQQLGADTHGLRIVRVLENRIDHKYFPLTQIPATVSLSANDSL